MLVIYRHLIGIIGTTVKLSKSPNSFNYGFSVKLILNKGSNVVGREESFFRKLYQEKMPHIFPQIIEDDNSTSDGFTTVTNRSKSTIRSSVPRPPSRIQSTN
jgi:hypothetical protein